MLLFVYGTLRIGGSANHLIAKQKLVDEKIKIPGLALFDYHGLYPFAVQSDEDSVVGDLYEVDEEALTELDEYEGETYKRVIIQPLDCFVYIQDGDNNLTCPRIEGGDWLKHLLKWK